MKIAEFMEKMIVFSKENMHDIDHFMKVWAYAKTIGELENIDDVLKQNMSKDCSIRCFDA